MNKTAKALITVIFTLMSFLTVYAAEKIAPGGDPRLVPAYESYRKGVMYEERGDNFRDREGRAQKMYEHAEDYYLDAAFRYEQLGLEYGTDTTAEQAVCNKSYRSVHVKTNEAKHNARKR